MRQVSIYIFLHMLGVGNMILQDLMLKISCQHEEVLTLLISCNQATSSPIKPQEMHISSCYLLRLDRLHIQHKPLIKINKTVRGWEKGIVVISASCPRHWAKLHMKGLWQRWDLGALLLTPSLMPSMSIWSFPLKRVIWHNSLASFWLVIPPLFFLSLSRSS